MGVQDNHRSRLEDLHSGEIYNPDDPEILKEEEVYQDLLDQFNLCSVAEKEKKKALLQKMFHSFGEDSYIEPPLNANFGGRLVTIGKHVYCNSNLTLVDDTKISIGDFTKLGPNVSLVTAGHPIASALREKGLQYSFPVQIGKNCWLGAGVIVLPGVTIGDNSVIGAGSVVTRDIPADVVAFGTPCRVIRPIGERDQKYYYREKEIPGEFFEK